MAGRSRSPRSERAGGGTQAHTADAATGGRADRGRARGRGSASLGANRARSGRPAGDGLEQPETYGEQEEKEQRREQRKRCVHVEAIGDAAGRAC